MFPSTLHLVEEINRILEDKRASLPDKPFYRAAHQAFMESDLMTMAANKHLAHSLENAGELLGSEMIQWRFWPRPESQLTHEYRLFVEDKSLEDGKVRTSFDKHLDGSSRQMAEHTFFINHRLPQEEVIDDILEGLNQLNDKFLL